MSEAPLDGLAQEGPAPVPVVSRRSKSSRTPLYPRLLRLRHVHPNAWQRAALGEGALGAAVLLVLADLASAWTLVALPVAVAVVVKAHDGLAGLLAGPAAAAADPAPDVGPAPAVEPAPTSAPATD